MVVQVQFQLMPQPHHIAGIPGLRLNEYTPDLAEVTRKVSDGVMVTPGTPLRELLDDYPDAGVRAFHSPGRNSLCADFSGCLLGASRRGDVFR